MSRTDEQCRLLTIAASDDGSTNMYWKLCSVDSTGSLMQ
ncbi:hypothetical protein R69619_06499 [Paraburkholderia nemoris]|nr:hypothetical protein R69619_06499 [Paraburkholderia nemoris]